MKEENLEKKSELIKRVNLDYQHCKLVEFFINNQVYS